MAKIGYARLAYNENDVQPQVDALKLFGCEEIYIDQEANHSEDFEELLKAFKCLKPGDALVVWRLDRLGKSTRQLTELTRALQKRKIHFVSLKEDIDTDTTVGQNYLKLMANLAEMEATLVRERTMIGLKEARKKGKIGGRPKIDVKNAKQIRHLYFSEKQTIQYISEKCGVSVGSVYKYINMSQDDFERAFI